MILSVRGTLVRKFMLAAHKLEMTRGEWAFLDVEIFHVRRYIKRNGTRKNSKSIYDGKSWNDTFFFTDVKAIKQF